MLLAMKAPNVIGTFQSACLAVVLIVSQIVGFFLSSQFWIDSVSKAREAHLIDKAMTLEPYDGINRSDELNSFIFLVAYHFLFAMYSNLAYVKFIFYLYSFSFHSPCWRFTVLNLKFGIQDFTDTGLLKIGRTPSGLSLSVCLHTEVLLLL